MLTLHLLIIVAIRSPTKFCPTWKFCTNANHSKHTFADYDLICSNQAVNSLSNVVIIAAFEQSALWQSLNFLTIPPPFLNSSFVRAFYK